MVKEKEKQPQTQVGMENVMRKIRIEKVVLSIGGTAEELNKGSKLLKFLTGKTPAKMKSRKRIPALGVRPGLEIGAVVTLREGIEEMLKRVLATNDNTLKKKQVGTNSFSFGVKEYIEIPGVEYQRDIGIRGFDVTVVFKRAGRRVKLRKTKTGKVPKKQHISSEEMIKFMEENFNTRFI